jgi:hypothetical protein
MSKKDPKATTQSGLPDPAEIADLLRTLDIGRSPTDTLSDRPPGMRGGLGWRPQGATTGRFRYVLTRGTRVPDMR